MARFHGRVGYGIQVLTAPDVWKDDITERIYTGDVVRVNRILRETDNLNGSLSLGNAISIVADAFAQEHFFAIKYVEWSGVFWTVSSVEVQRPRLILNIGEVYNGERPN